jgi:hypothetical protein
MALKLVSPSQEPPTLNVLLYGPPKAGKTVGASSAPGPVLYLNAERPNATRFAHRLRGDELHEVRLEGLSTLIDVIDHFRSGKAEERTVVLDPVGEAHRLLLEEASDRAIRPKIQEYGDVSTHLERFCRALCDLPVNAVFVTHETAVKDDEAGQRLPFTGTSNPAPAAKLMAMVDVIGYCGVVEPDDDGPVRYVAQLVTANGRRGGDRTGTLGKLRDLDLADWVAAGAKPLPPPAKDGNDKGKTKSSRRAAA